MIRYAVAGALLAAVGALGCSQPTAPPATSPGVTAKCPARMSPPAGTPAPSPAVTLTLQFLNGHISSALTSLQNDLPRNSRYAEQYNAKIAMLLCPTLAQDIVADQDYVEGKAVSADGRTIPIVSVFPDGSMRAAAAQAVQFIELALPVLEEFMQLPFPRDVVRIWYGFAMGSSGGGGELNMEDEASWNSRLSSGLPPYQAILAHELSHTYIGHESLTQFLEVYVYNVARSGSPDLGWGYLRGSSFQGADALQNVYSLIGRRAMSNAYRAAFDLHPPYGQILSAECRQVFVSQAPLDLRPQVTSEMARVTY